MNVFKVWYFVTLSSLYVLYNGLLSGIRTQLRSIICFVNQVGRCTKIISPNTKDAKYVINIRHHAKVHFYLAFTLCSTFFGVFEIWKFSSPTKNNSTTFKFCPSIFIFSSFNLPYHSISAFLLFCWNMNNWETYFIIKFICSTIFVWYLPFLNCFQWLTFYALQTYNKIL